MPSATNDFRLTLTHLLFPISLMAFTLMLMFAFQSTQILRDRDILHETKGNQTRAFEDSQRLQAQLNALLLGTQKLADEGDKNAKVIVERLKEIGITINKPEQTPAASAPAAPVPAAREKTEPGPVKP